VAVTVDGFTFRTSIAKMGGRFLLGVSAERRARAGIEAGQVFDVDVELDTAPREIEVPDDLAAALAADVKAKDTAVVSTHRGLGVGVASHVPGFGQAMRRTVVALVLSAARYYADKSG
jgi:hypothetical protein